MFNCKRSERNREQRLDLGKAEAPSRGKVRRCSASRAGFVDWALSHQTVYMGLYGWHLFAAVEIEKPEVYVPIAILYLLLSLKA